MALQSSGQIKLSEIATEFGGSAPHSLSEYYGVASGVPASGQIKLGADFYGTSNIVIVAAGSMTAGTVTEAKNSSYSARYTGRDNNTAYGNSSIGSMSLSTNTIQMTGLFDQEEIGSPSPGPQKMLCVEVSSVQSAQEIADFWYIKIGNTYLSRRKGDLLFNEGGSLSGTGGSNANLTGSTGFHWGSKTNYNFGFVSGSTYSFEMAEMRDDDVWLDTTLTVDHWFDQGNVNKAGGINFRGYSSSSNKGSLGSSTCTNPDDFASNTCTLTEFKISQITGDELSPPNNSVNIAFSGAPLQGIRGILLTKSNNSKMFYPVGQNASSSNVRDGASLIIDQNVGLWNFFSTDNQQINLKVY